MENTQKSFCRLCRRHCAEDNLQCSQGRKCFEQDLQESYKIKEYNGEYNGKYKEDISMGNFRDNMDYENNAIEKDDLLALLHKSSHFLHHRRGGKRGQGKILKLLAEHSEISQKELQELLGIESGSMSELVIKLEQKGLITRTKDESDKRMTKLMITHLGLEVSKEIEEKDEEEDKLLADFLTPGEQEQLKELLSKLLQGWEEHHGALRMGQGCQRGRGQHGCHDKHRGCRGHHGHHGHHGDQEAREDHEAREDQKDQEHCGHHGEHQDRSHAGHDHSEHHGERDHREHHEDCRRHHQGE